MAGVAESSRSSSTWTLPDLTARSRRVRTPTLKLFEGGAADAHVDLGIEREQLADGNGQARWNVAADVAPARLADEVAHEAVVARRLSASEVDEDGRPRPPTEAAA